MTIVGGIKIALEDRKSLFAIAVLPSLAPVA